MKNGERARFSPPRIDAKGGSQMSNPKIRQPIAPNVEKTVPPRMAKAPITTGPGTVGIVDGKGASPTSKPTGEPTGGKQ
jgi:hypothetical protein